MKPLHASIKALELAKLATGGIPVPGLSTAVECALSITKKAKEIEDTRDDCRVLAERVATLTLAIYQQLKNGSSDAGVSEPVTMFLLNLRHIENLMDRRLRPRTRDRIWFVFKHGKIADEVKTLTTKLEDAFRTFMIQTTLAIDQNIGILTSGNVRMMQHIDDSARVGDTILGQTRMICTDISDLAHRVGGGVRFDGDLRIFVRENLALLEPIIDSHKPWNAATTQQGLDEHTIIQTMNQPRTGRVIRYRAVMEAAGHLTGTKAVVHVYPNHDDLQFVEALKFAKRTFHPNVLAIMGYSRRGGPDQAAYIVTEDYLPFVEHLSSLHGTSKLRMYLQMEAAMYMAADYLETRVELRRLFPTRRYWNFSATSHFIGSDEVVFDHRHGGRIKWARDAIALDKIDDIPRIEVSAARGDRMHIIRALPAVACAPLDTVVWRWLSLIMSPLGGYRDLLLGRLWWPHWEHIANYPRYPLGVWLGRNSFDKHWTCISAQDDAVEVAVTIQRVPNVLPSPRLGRNFAQRMRMGEWFDVQDLDLAEMCITFQLGTGENQTRWKRYQFSCVPVNTTLLFQQRAHVLDWHDAAPWVIRALPHPSVVGLYTRIGMTVYRDYHTETTVMMRAHAAKPVAPPLWFFALQFDVGDNSAHDCNIPCGFWSSERYPTSVPADIIFDTMPLFEPINDRGVEAPLFTSTQVLEDLVFITQTKMHTETLQLTEDELLAFREFQENHTSTSDDDTSRSDNSDRDGFETDDNSDEENTGQFDIEPLASSYSNYNHAARLHCHGPPEPEHQDAMDAGYDSADEYHSAEEEEGTGLACGECRS